MLKTLVATCALVLAGQAFADTYKGGGSWKMADGTQGKWSETMDVTESQTGFSFTEQLSILGADGQPLQAMTANYSAKYDANDFFDVLDTKGNKVGRGYVFVEKGMKLVHVETTQSSMKSEWTWVFAGDRVDVIGSNSGSLNGKPFEVAYEGELKP